MVRHLQVFTCANGFYRYVEAFLLSASLIGSSKLFPWTWGQGAFSAKANLAKPISVESKNWYMAHHKQAIAQITGKVGQWPSGSTQQPERAANCPLAVLEC